MWDWPARLVVAAFLSSPVLLWLALRGLGVNGESATFFTVVGFVLPISFPGHRENG